MTVECPPPPPPPPPLPSSPSYDDDDDDDDDYNHDHDDDDDDDDECRSQRLSHTSQRLSQHTLPLTDRNLTTYRHSFSPLPDLSRSMKM